ncbi:MAG: hypothetical protein AAF560_23365 [Acidobacteriota bacterium]
MGLPRQQLADHYAVYLARRPPRCRDSRANGAARRGDIVGERQATGK